MAVKSLFKVFANQSAKEEKEKLIEKQKPPKRNSVPVIVGCDTEEKKRYQVPIKYLHILLPKPENEADLNIDSPVRIYCPTELFDEILKALKKNEIA